MASPPSRSTLWAATMRGAPGAGGVVVAHSGNAPPALAARQVSRQARELAEDRTLAGGATRAHGAGNRSAPEEPDPLRTCFERDRDRILHSAAFRRLAGKTQVFLFPRDHQRTRLTHALEVAQVATAVSRAVGLNTALTEAIALGHDCGHGPGGHASEDAFSPFVPGGYNHALWGADVALAGLNLCAETLDGIRHHSWSLPTPATPEGVVVSWADRCAYSAHDLEDAIHAGVVGAGEIPDVVAATAGTTRSSQLRAFIGALVRCISETGTIGMYSQQAEALAALRAFNYERIYTRPDSAAQGEAVIALLRALVNFYVAHPSLLPPVPPAAGTPPGARRRLGSPTRLEGPPPGEGEPAAPDVHRAVAYVSGMTDRYAFETAITHLGWRTDRLPQGVDVPQALVRPYLAPTAAP